MEIDADIIGVQELENVEGNEAAKDMRGKLNYSSDRNYTFASREASLNLIGGDVVKVDILLDIARLGFLYVDILTDDKVDEDLLANSTKGAIFDGFSHVPLVVSLEDNESGDVLTVVV